MASDLNGDGPTELALNGRGGRDPIRGTFVQGNQAARKNRGAKAVAELRRELIASVATGEVAALGKRVYAMALAGDIGAARLWLEYVLGKPLQGVEVSGLDGGPIDTSLKVEAVVLGIVAAQPELRIKLAESLMAIGEDGEDDDEFG